MDRLVYEEAYGAAYREVMDAARVKKTPGTPCGKGWTGNHPSCKRGAKAKPAAAAKAKPAAAPKAKTPAPAAPTAGKASTKVMDLSPDQIAVDAKRFQYKLSSNAQGEVGSLGGVQKWDDNLAGVVSVWKDPADGKTYVVNGHNRLALAKRLGAEAVTVRYLDAANEKEARAIGAMQNIAGGQGTSLDAAKFFRDSGIKTEQEAADRGLPLKSGRTSEGIALSRLPDHLFNAVIQGEMTTGRGAIIGGSGLDETKQGEIYKMVKARKNITDGTLKELVDTARQSEQTKEVTFDLFGGSETVKDNLVLRAKVTDKLKRKLSSEKRLFGMVSKSKAAADLEAKAGNKINQAESGAIAKEATQLLNIFDKLKNESGPISAAINAAVARIEKGESEAAVMRELQSSTSQAIKDMFGGKKKTDSADKPKDGIDWGRVAREAKIMIDLNPQDIPDDETGVLDDEVGEDDDADD